eukprot:scaffold26636_cov17-Tisochrysis_lutea.AAC.1
MVAVAVSAVVRRAAVVVQASVPRLGLVHMPVLLCAVGLPGLVAMSAVVVGMVAVAVSAVLVGMVAVA